MATSIPLQYLLFHEVWICLQHGNVLMNPLCQRLDRNYGISLFKNDMVWVIAFTLSAYWMREIVSMAFCYGMVTQSTKYLIIASSAYHAFKIVNVNIDAWRKWSPKLGILRLLLDYWHFDTVVNCIISFKRMFLQGFDTAVHFCIICDICESSEMIRASYFFSSKKSVIIVAATIWLFHALVVQVSRKSTATVMVGLYRKIAELLNLVEVSKAPESVELPSIRESKHRHSSDKNRGTTLDLFLGPHIHTARKSSHDCKVCRMLAKPVDDNRRLKSTGPSVVFLAHPMQLSSAFSLWSDKGKCKESYWRASWWMENPIVSSIVFFISFAVYPVCVWLGLSPVVVVDRSSHSFQHERNSPQKSATPGDTGFTSSATPTRSEVWFAKSFGWQYASSSSFWQGYAKEMVVRSAVLAARQGVQVIGLGALNKAHWLNNGGEDLVAELDRRIANELHLKNEKLVENLELNLESGCSEISSSVGIRVVHGNTLTAAVVCYQLKILLAEHIQEYVRIHGTSIETKPMTVILLGATSKIGRAVALTMATTDDVRVICVGVQSKRLDSILKDTRDASLARGGECTVTSCTDILCASEMAPNAVWLLGKGDRSSPLVDIIPFRATVLSFAVPCPLANLDATGLWMKSTISTASGGVQSKQGRDLLRDDIRYIDAGVIELPKALQEQRQFALMLPNRFAYSCHAAALIHHLEKWRHHEVGEVILENMEITLTAAFKHGFAVDAIESVRNVHNTRTCDVRTVDVAVIGCGPGGLGAAACLLLNDSNTTEKEKGKGTKGSHMRTDFESVGNSGGGGGKEHSPRGLKIAMFERHTDIEGQWLTQYQGLSLTSRGQHSALPHLKIPKCLFDVQNNDPTKKDHNLPRNQPSDIKINNYSDNNAKDRNGNGDGKTSGDGELTAESYVRYLKLYARRYGLESSMNLGCSVVKVCRAGKGISHNMSSQRHGGDIGVGVNDGGVGCTNTYHNDTAHTTHTSELEGDGWEVHVVENNSISGEIKYVINSRCVVVACGKSQVPSIDPLLSAALKGYTGHIVNAKDVKDIAALESKGSVLIVGCGNSALDISSSLLKIKSLKKNSDSRCYASDDILRDLVHVSMRSIPPCIPRQWGPLSVEEMSVWILQYLPVDTADFVVWAFYRILSTGGTGYIRQVPGGKSNPDWYPFSSRRVPPIDKGGFAKAVSEGRIVLHSCISSTNGKEVNFSHPKKGCETGRMGDGMRTGVGQKGLSGNDDVIDKMDADVIVVCTGYTADWNWLDIKIDSTSNSSFSSSSFSPIPPLYSSPSQYSGSTQTSYSSIQSPNSNSKISYRNNALSTYARTQCRNPEKCTDGLFFIGYDPGDALIPLMAMREQAVKIAKCAKKTCSIQSIISHV